MNENQSNNRCPRRKFSEEEKRNYYLAWKKSGMHQRVFCKANKISRSAFYQWSKKFKNEESDFCFAPLALDTPAPASQADMIQLKIRLPNKTRLKLSISKYGLVSFIKEISDATTVIR